MTSPAIAKRFPGSKSRRANWLYLALCAMLSVMVGTGFYYSGLNWFITHKGEEKLTALRLVDAFVSHYSEIQSQLGADATAPSTFRAHSIEAFNQKLGADDNFRLLWVGRPGKQIRTAPSDPAMAAAIEAFASECAAKADAKFLSLDGQVVFRTIYPSFAHEQSCVNCHNNLQPAANWRVGDLMGAFVIDVPAAGFLRTLLLESIRAGLALFIALAAVGFAFSRQHAHQMAEREAAAAEILRTRTFLDTVVENIPAVITVRDAATDEYVLVNRSTEKLVGLSRDDLMGRRPHDVLPSDVADWLHPGNMQAPRSGDVAVWDECEIGSADGSSRFLATKSLVIPGETGEPTYLLSLSEDITERKRAQAQIVYLARHDPLTGLPNRRAFAETLAATLDQARAADKGFALIAVDVDGFMEVNDVYGASTGDALLRAVAGRLESALGGAHLARVGDDEFAMIWSGGPQAAASEALAERLHAIFAAEIEVEGRRMRTSVSVGIAIFPADGATAHALIANADAALYRAKEAGRGRTSFFDFGMDTRLRGRRALQNELRSALAQRELELYYQPQTLMTGEFVGMEALVRWRHPTRGMVSPGIFIPLAEESELIMPIGEWVLREACREAASWARPLRVAVNISPLQFRHGDLPGLVLGILLETGLPAERLELEITEGVLVEDFSRAFATLQRLKSIGLRIAMDDFGTGYSSLSYLQAFPFDKIKIDQSFIARLGVSAQSEAIVRSVIGLARGLQMPVLAEGVENRLQLAFLASEGCDEAQGYLLGRPGPIAQYAGEVDGEADNVTAEAKRASA